MTKDRATGAIALILGIMVAFMTSQLPQSTMAGDVGPKVFPYIAAGILIICGVGLLVTGGQKAEVFFTKAQAIRLLIIFAVVLAYVIAMRFFGFAVPTAIVLVVLCSMFAQGKNVPWWARIVFSLVITGIVYFMFTEVLNLRLPQGTLF